VPCPYSEETKRACVGLHDDMTTHMAYGGIGGGGGGVSGGEADIRKAGAYSRSLFSST
jgi:hypothetical protein